MRSLHLLFSFLKATSESAIFISKTSLTLLTHLGSSANIFFSFIPAIIEWNDLDPSPRNSNSISVFKEKILNFLRPSPNSLFDCHSPKRIKLIIRLRLGLSHLREQKFKHSFHDK